MNLPKLRGKLAENEMNVGELANCIGVNRASLYRKLRAKENITIGEAKKIKEALSLSNAEAYEIFFG